MIPQEEVDALLVKYDGNVNLSLQRNELENHMRILERAYDFVKRNHEGHEALDVTLFLIVMDYRRSQERLHKLLNPS
jgi:hypothetical protein